MCEVFSLLVMARVAAMPPMPGMDWSMNTMLIASVAILSSASSPEAAISTSSP